MIPLVLNNLQYFNPFLANGTISCPSSIAHFSLIFQLYSEDIRTKFFSGVFRGYKQQKKICFMMFSEATKSNILQKAVREKAVLFLYKRLVRPL